MMAEAKNGRNISKLCGSLLQIRSDGFWWFAKTNELLTRSPEVLAKYQNRFRYILVDEYQDTNHPNI
jgi:hypothetical protein